MAEESNKDWFWLIDQFDQIENGGEPVLIQGFTNHEIRMAWNTGANGVGCELILADAEGGVMISIKPYKPNKRLKKACTYTFFGLIVFYFIVSVVGKL